MLIASPEGQAHRRRCAVSPTFATVKYQMRLGTINQLMPPETSRQNLTYTLHRKPRTSPQFKFNQHREVITDGQSVILNREARQRKHRKRNRSEIRSRWNTKIQRLGLVILPLPKEMKNGKIPCPARGSHSRSDKPHKRKSEPRIHREVVPKLAQCDMG